MTRCAIVGTAPSWIHTPWADTSLEIWSLNDAYCSRDLAGHGIPRADRWFEQHPLDKFYFRPAADRVVYADKIPPGHYVRPEGHLEWLKTQAASIQVILRDDPPEGWPAGARRYPIEAVEAKFGCYWASGPSYMVALALFEGYREIHIYGIHLTTQLEYVEQRPNFEHWLGIARGMGVSITMAEESPLLKHGWRYGYDARPTGVSLPQAAELATVQREKFTLVTKLVNWPRFKSKHEAMMRLRRLEARELALQQTLRHLHGIGGTVHAIVLPAA